AFISYGLDVTASPDKVASLIHAAAIKDQLVAGLLEWAWAIHQKGRPGWERLIDIARRADTDPWRDRLLAAFLRQDRQALAGMTRAEQVSELPPAAALLLARALFQLGEGALALRVCQRVQGRHPSDFELNLCLAELLWAGPNRLDALAFWRAALAVRPQSAA